MVSFCCCYYLPTQQCIDECIVFTGIYLCKSFFFVCCYCVCTCMCVCVCVCFPVQVYNTSESKLFKLEQEQKVQNKRRYVFMKFCFCSFVVFGAFFFFFFLIMQTNEAIYFGFCCCCCGLLVDIVLRQTCTVPLTYVLK